MEVIAGLDDLNVEVVESMCKFRFNYGKVYWNSRLQAEHDRLVRDILRRGGVRLGSNTASSSQSKQVVVADMFAGVGPFSMPLAKARAIVYANDLNPDSYAYLVENSKLNKISAARHVSSNLDGREFMVDLVRRKKIMPTDVIMNLPAIATEFLDVFRGLYEESVMEVELPTIHCYAFAMEDSFHQDLLDRIESALGTKVIDPLIHDVRNIAPKKNMYCVTFNLPSTIARFSPSQDASQEYPPESKRPKLGESSPSL